MPSFTISCSTAKWNEVKPYILLAAPNQTLEPGEANLSDNNWIKYKFLLLIKGLVTKGKHVAREQAQNPFEDDAFTIS